MTDAIAQRLASIREQIASVGRDPASVEIVGVTKFQPLTVVEAGIAAGLTCLGNNYAQPGQTLMADLPKFAGRWHFVGHIQSRKIKFLVDYDCVQSFDRLELAQDLDARLADVGRKIDCLVEINIGGEAQKSGIDPQQLSSWIEASRNWNYLNLRGLMAMPPLSGSAEARRPFFREMKSIFDNCRRTFPLDCLSMGTSSDFLVAVEEGATMIRLGETLFGSRPPKAS